MTDEYKCSFCGKTQRQVTKMTINGDGKVAICNECVDAIVWMAEEEAR